MSYQVGKSLLSGKLLSLARVLGLCISLTLLAGCTAAPVSADPMLSALLTDVKGNVLTGSNSGNDFHKAANSDVIYTGDQVKTLEDGSVRLDISNHAIMRLGPNTLFTLRGSIQQNGDFFTSLQVSAGKLWIVLLGGFIQVETPQGLAAVRGSYLSVDVLPSSGTFITCLEGDCSLENAAGGVLLVAGETASMVSSSQAPALARMDDAMINDWLANIPEAQAVMPIAQWTMTALPTPTLGPSPTPFGASLLPANLPLETAAQTLELIPGNVVQETQPPLPTIVATLAIPATSQTSVINTPTHPAPTLAFTSTNPAPTATFTLTSLPPTDTLTVTSPAPTDTSTPTVAVPTATPADHSTHFSGETGPSGSINHCANNYSVKVSDHDGVFKVWVYASVNGGAYATYPLHYAGGTTWHEPHLFIAAHNGDSISYTFKARDGHGNLTIDTFSQSFTLTRNCP